MVLQSEKCLRSAKKDFNVEDKEEGADPIAVNDTLTVFWDEMR